MNLLASTSGMPLLQLPRSLLESRAASHVASAGVMLLPVRRSWRAVWRSTKEGFVFTSVHGDRGRTLSCCLPKGMPRSNVMVTLSRFFPSSLWSGTSRLLVSRSPSLTSFMMRNLRMPTNRGEPAADAVTGGGAEHYLADAASSRYVAANAIAGWDGPGCLRCMDTFGPAVPTTFWRVIIRKVQSRGQGSRGMYHGADC